MKFLLLATILALGAATAQAATCSEAIDQLTATAKIGLEDAFQESTDYNVEFLNELKAALDQRAAESKPILDDYNECSLLDVLCRASAQLALSQVDTKYTTIIANIVIKYLGTQTPTWALGIGNVLLTLTTQTLSLPGNCL